MDERLIGHAADEGVDHVDIGDVVELVVLLGEALDVLPESLVGPLPIVVEVPQVPRQSVHTLKVIDKHGTKVSPAVDATRLELLKPCSSQAR